MSVPRMARHRLADDVLARYRNRPEHETTEYIQDIMAEITVITELIDREYPVDGAIVDDPHVDLSWDALTDNPLPTIRHALNDDEVENLTDMLVEEMQVE